MTRNTHGLGDISFRGFAAVITNTTDYAG